MEDITYIKGRPYTYDADFDVYRPYVEAPTGFGARWGWVVVLAVLTVVCFWVSLPK